jgi:hypothetical protein
MIKDVGENTVAAVSGLAFEIARLVVDKVGDTPRSGEHLRAIVASTSGEVLCNWILGEFNPVRVHILRRGFPVCGFTDKPPAEWPGGDRWVGDDDQAAVTCTGCRSAVLQEQIAARDVPE